MVRKSMRSSRQHVIAFAAMLGLLVGGIAKTEAADYKFTFTKIADTADFSQFCGPPALNDKGVVAFSATLKVGTSGIFTGDGTSPRTIAEGSVPCSVFGPPSISDSGVLAFRFSLVFGQDKIIRTDGSTSKTIAEIGSGGFQTFLGHPSINDSDTVAFSGRDGTGSAIFRSDGSTTTPIAHTPSPFMSFGDNPSLNDGGAVAFRALDSTGIGIFRSDGTSPTTIAQTSGPSGLYFSLGSFPSLNNEGAAVAFLGTLDTFVSGIFVSDGTTTTTIADNNSASPFGGFNDSPSINDKGVVAFWASRKMGAGGGHGIFTGPDPATHKVIAKGDVLDGSKVSDLTFGPFGREGLNNAGQVAFRAKLEDGRTGIYRADPVPSNVPPDCSASQATPGMLWPPDHTFGTVAITGVTDPDNNPVVITVTSIRQDEPVKGRGDGNTAPDGVGVGSPLVMVRAERSGRGDGRAYHVSFTADDGQSGQCTGEVAVCVPHDQRPGAVCGDQGALFDSTAGPEGPGS